MKISNTSQYNLERSTIWLSPSLLSYFALQPMEQKTLFSLAHFLSYLNSIPGDDQFIAPFYSSQMLVPVF